MMNRNLLKLAFVACAIFCASCASSYEDRLDALNQPGPVPAQPAEAPPPAPALDTTVSRDDIALSGACIVNADCASTQYCDLGRCKSDCGAEKACDSGLYCSKRGKCAVDKNYVDVDPPIKAVPPVAWSVDASVIKLDTAQDSASFNINVTGGGALKYRVQVEPSSAAPSVTVSDPEGVVGAGGSKAVNVTIDRSGFEIGDHDISINVVSDGGQKNVVYEFSNGLTGRYAGFIEYSNPWFGRIPVIVDVKVGDNGGVTGHTVDAGSLFFPDNRALSGQYFKDKGQIYISLLDLVKTAAERNVFERDVSREVSFMGDVSEQGVIKGDIEEIISGLMPNTVNVAGSFYLTRISENVSDAITEPVSKIPVFTPTTAALTCTGLGCTGLIDACSTANFAFNMIYCSKLIEASAFSLDAKFKVKDSQGQNAVNYGIVDECEADVTNKLTSSCVNLNLLEYMRNNQQEYLKKGNASNDEYSQYFNDLNGMQHLYAFIGNDKLVEAYRVPTHEISNPLSQELGKLADALDYYESAEKTFFSANNISLLTAASTNAVSANNYEVFRVPLQYIRASDAALTRTVSLNVRKSFASSSIKTQLRKQVQDYARIIYLEGVALAKLVTTHGGSFAFEIAQVSDEVQSMGLTAGTLEAGLNPLGFPQDYVPFVYNPSDTQNPTNFQQLVKMAELTTDSAVQKAQTAENEAQQLEVRTEDIQQRITEIESSYGSQLLQLCGVADIQFLDECGANGGEFALKLNEIKEQYLDIEKKYQSIMDLNEMVKIKNDLALQVAGIKGQTLRFMQANGATLESLDIAEGEIKAAMMKKSGLFGSIGGFISGALDIAGGIGAMVLSGGATAAVSAGQATAQAAVKATNDKGNFNPGAGLGGVASGLSGFVNAGMSAAASATSGSMAKRLSQVDAQKRHMQDLQQMRFQEESADIAAAEAAAAVKELLLQMAQLNIDLEMANLRLDTDVIQMNNILAQADYLMHQREVLISQAKDSVNNPLSNLSFRLQRDHAVLLAVNEFEKALSDVYLAARGLEYELNVNLPQIETQLFQTDGAQQLKDFLNCLQSWYNDYTMAFGSPHEEVTQISLREDVLGFTQPVTDEVTKQVIEPEEIFRRVLLNPKHITQSGRVEFPFTVSIAGSDKLFSTLVCNDRIEKVRVMLVGDFLGDNEATAMIRQEGDSTLRDCTADSQKGNDIINTYHLDDRTALVQTGVNSFGIGSPSYDLTGRSVSSDRWVLVIPTGSEAPNNKDLDLMHLDDVVIEVTHEARTLTGKSPTNVFGQCNI